MLSNFNSLLKLKTNWVEGLIDLDTIIKKGLLHMKEIVSLSLTQYDKNSNHQMMPLLDSLVQLINNNKKIELVELAISVEDLKQLLNRLKEELF